MQFSPHGKTMNKVVSKDITEDILLNAGFKETGRNDGVYVTFELTNRISVTNYRTTCDNGTRKWYCEVSNNNGDCAEVDIQTIDHLNKLVELMDIDFKLKEG